MENKLINKGDIDFSFFQTFNSMEEGIKYRLWPKTFETINDQRIKSGDLKITPFTFTKEKDSLGFVWLENGWAKSTVKIEQENTTFAFALSFAYTFSLAFAFAFAEQQIEKVKPEQTCDGKEVLIEGKTYILKLKS